MENLYNKASLVLTPQMVETGKVYSMKPEDRKGDFTFSRSTYATRVGPTGLIEKETQNLLSYSNTFDNALWSHNSITLTSGQVGYDGSNDAWKLDKAAIAYTSFHQDVSTSGVQTISLYVKAGTLNTGALYVDGTVSSYAVYDLTNGNNSLKTSGVIYAGSTDKGNGWYRIYMVVNTSVTRVRFYPDWSGSTAGNVYIQDAQLEQGLVARDYIETTTTAIYGGITDNVPRLDYTDSSCPALLLEPQRTNVFDYSEYASGNSSANAPTLVDNYAVSPEGYQNAFQISTDAGTFRRVRKILTGLSGNTSYSMSIFVKKATSAISTYGGLGMVWQGGTQKVNYIIFDEYNGTMSILQDQTGNTSTKVDDVGGYWRFSVSATDTGSNTSFEAAYYACLSATGSTIGVGVKTWVGYGFQLEAGSYATSYIPTYGSAVTRNNDGQNLQLDGVKTNGFFGNSYSIYFEFDNLDFGPPSQANFNYLYDEGNFLCMYVYSTTLAIHTDSGEQYTNFTQGFTDASKGKFLVKYDGNEVKIFKDGSLYRTYTNPSSRWDNPKLYRLSLLAATATISYKSFMTFPTALTDQEAIDLTTI